MTVGLTPSCLSVAVADLLPLSLLSLLEESDSVDMVDMEVDDLIDSNEINDDVGSMIDIIAGL